MRNNYFVAFIFIPVPLFLIAQIASLSNNFRHFTGETYESKSINSFCLQVKNNNFSATIHLVTGKQIVERFYSKPKNMPVIVMIHDIPDSEPGITKMLVQPFKR